MKFYLHNYAQGKVSDILMFIVWFNRNIPVTVDRE